MSKNDEKIVALQTKITEKKSKFSKVKKFMPDTNCSLELFGQRYNLNTLQKADLEYLLVVVNMFKLSAASLATEIYLSGYHVNLWISDIKQKLDILKNKLEEANLKTLQEKLDKLLSNEKRTELEIENIAKLLE